MAIKPDKYEALKNWGNALSSQAKTKDGAEREGLFKESEKKLLQVEVIKKGRGAYNLACLSALRGDEQGCREWLEVGHDAGTLQTREYAMRDEDFESVRDKDWFKAIRWKGEI